MIYSYEALIEAASEPNEHGTRFLTIEMDEGDIAFAPGTTKYDLRAHGEGTVAYTFYREGTEATVTGKIHRALKAGQS